MSDRGQEREALEETAYQKYCDEDLASRPLVPSHVFWHREGFAGGYRAALADCVEPSRSRNNWKDLTTVPVVQRPDVTYIEPMGSSDNYRGAFRVKPDGTVAITPDADPLEVQAILEHKARLAGLDEHHPTSGECW